MKNTLFALVSFIIIAGCKPPLDAVRKVDKTHQDTPPGTVWIKDSIYMDKCEVRNLDYLEYVHWLKKNDTINYLNALPDTLVWRDKNSYNEPYVNMYFWHPAYRNYPVVGISYEQALAYCKWRTDRVKEFAKLISPKSKFASSYKNKHFYYRLPTKAEWETAAYAGNRKQYGFESLHKKDNSPNFNVVETYMLDYIGSGADITMPVASNKPNSFGVYNAIGNVAEMIMTKGISKGGGWRNSLQDCEVSDSVLYDKPIAWLGFRCVCVVTK